MLRNRGRFARWEQDRERGCLDYQMRNGQMYPPKLLATPASPRKPLDVRAEFDGLHDERILRQIFGLSAPERSDEHFAVGLEHGNSTVGNSLFNALFLREDHRRCEPPLGR
jgi:prostaglandin-endoperoxide synthase 2